MFSFFSLCREAACHPGKRKEIIPFLSAFLAGELYVISFIVNNAFSFSYTLKFVLKQFRKLVEVECYFNLKSLGLQLQSHLFFSFSFLYFCIFPPIIIILFYSLILNFMHWFPSRYSFPVLLWWGERWLIDSHIGSVFKVPLRVSILISKLPPVS